MISEIIKYLFDFVSLKVDILLSEISEQSTKEDIILSEKNGKVIAFEIQNEGCNADLLVGRNQVYFTIRPGDSKVFCLDSWFYYCTTLECKFKEHIYTEGEDIIKRGIIIKKVIKRC